MHDSEASDGSLDAFYDAVDELSMLHPDDASHALGLLSIVLDHVVQTPMEATYQRLSRSSMDRNPECVEALTLALTLPSTQPFH